VKAERPQAGGKKAAKPPARAAAKSAKPAPRLTDRQFAPLGDAGDDVIEHVQEAFANDLGHRDPMLAPPPAQPGAARSTADDVAKVLQRREARLRFAEIMMTLELCRHPMSLEQVERAEQYVAAMRIDNVEIEVTRIAITKGAEAAATDLERCYRRILPEISELSLRDRYLRLDKPDHALAERLRKLRDLPEDTLGYQYLEFYRRNNIELPGDVDQVRTARRLGRRLGAFHQQCEGLQAGRGARRVQELPLPVEQRRGRR
jgi:hypothetical protein